MYPVKIFNPGSSFKYLDRMAREFLFRMGSSSLLIFCSKEITFAKLLFSIVDTGVDLVQDGKVWLSKYKFE
jgi:hypothetical protein